MNTQLSCRERNCVHGMSLQAWSRTSHARTEHLRIHRTEVFARVSYVAVCHALRGCSHRGRPSRLHQHVPLSRTSTSTSCHFLRIDSLTTTRWKTFIDRVRTRPRHLPELHAAVFLSSFNPFRYVHQCRTEGDFRSWSPVPYANQLLTISSFGMSGPFIVSPTCIRAQYRPVNTKHTPGADRVVCIWPSHMLIMLRLMS